MVQQLFDLCGNLSGLADRDTEFRLPTGTGDEFLHGDGPRDAPKPVVQSRDMFVHDRHIDTLKVKARNFRRLSDFSTEVRRSPRYAVKWSIITVYHGD